MADLTEKLLNWLPMTAALVHDHGPGAPALQERYLRRHPGAAYWIGDGPCPTDGLLLGVLDVLVLRFGAVEDPGALAEQLLEARAWLNPGGVLLVALLDHGGLFTPQQRSALAQAGLYFTKQGAASGWRVLVLMAGKPQPLHIRAIPLREQAGMVDVRLRQPLQALSTLPDVHAEVMSLPVMGRMISQPSRVLTVVLWQRPILKPERDERLILRLKSSRIKLVVDFDDHPMRWPEITRSNFYTFRAADGLITSTRSLQSLLDGYCSKVFLSSNTCFELPILDQKIAFNDQRPLSLIFASLNRSQDARPYLKILNQFITQNETSLRFDVIGDQEFFKGLSTANKIYCPITDYPSYLKKMRGADLVFSPLSDNTFNKYKSYLKYIEAAAAETIMLASPTVYSEVIRDGCNGFIIDQHTLYYTIQRICRNQASLGHVAFNAKEDLLSNHMSWQNLFALRSWLLSLWD